MREYLTILAVGLALSFSGAILAAQAAEAKGAEPGARASERTEVTPKAATCRPKWPYIVLTCNA